MKRSIIVVIMISAALLLSAVTQDITVKEKALTLEFDNVFIKDIVFVDGNDIVIDHAKDAKVIISKDKQVINIKAEDYAKIKLEFPIGKIYTLIVDGGKVEFNENRVSIFEDNVKKVEFRDGGLFITDDGENVEISSDGILVNSGDEFVEVSSRGIIVETPEESQHITGFWGQLLGGAINLITKSTIGWIGNNPGYIVKHMINDDDYNNDINIGFSFDNDENITREFHETFHPKKICELNVHNINGQIEIKSWDEDFIDISALLKTNRTEDELDKIKIEILAKDGCTINTKKLKKNPKVSVHYEIKVPKNVQVNKINTSNGKILIIGGTGNMKLNTSNGKIEVFDSKGSFIANSSNGRIEYVNLKGKAEAYTSNGAIRIVRTPGFKTGVTSNGKITIEVDEQIKNNVDLSTSNGTIHIYLDPKLDLNIDASTSNSRINLNGIEVTTSEFSKDYLAGKINKGGKKIIASSSNGSINLYKLEK